MASVRWMLSRLHITDEKTWAWRCCTTCLSKQGQERSRAWSKGPEHLPSFPCCAPGADLWELLGPPLASEDLGAVREVCSAQRILRRLTLMDSPSHFVVLLAVSAVVSSVCQDTRQLIGGWSAALKYWGGSPWVRECLMLSVCRKCSSSADWDPWLYLRTVWLEILDWPVCVSEIGS